MCIHSPPASDIHQGKSVVTLGYDYNTNPSYCYRGTSGIIERDVWEEVGKELTDTERQCPEADSFGEL